MDTHLILMFWYEALQLMEYYIGIGDTAQTTDIHNMELLSFHYNLFWKMGSCRKHEFISEGHKPTIFWCQTAF